MMDRVPMTPEGYQKLREELEERLKRQKVIIERLKEARAHGDFSENAELDAAREEQAFNEGRIRELESILSLAQVITNDQMNGSTVVAFGAWVTLREEDTGEPIRYQIVGKFEADVKRKKISIDSPIAKAAIGKKVGDWIHVITPKGEKGYDIDEITYGS